MIAFHEVFYEIIGLYVGWILYCILYAWTQAVVRINAIAA